MAVPFFLVDVFAEAPLTGNPLALVAEADGLDEPVMQSVAREFNQSETTFLLRPTRDAATWRLRSFTPSGAEVFGAGHNALGAWWWLATAGKLALDAGAGRFAQEIGERVLPVEVVGTKNGQPAEIWMEQARPDFGRTANNLPELAAALGLDADDLLPGAQVVSTGAAHLLVPVSDRSALNRARPESARLAAALRALGAQGCYVYTRDAIGRDAAAQARFFNPTVGIWEDPATGSAAGPLACQLVAQAVVDDGATITIEQGHAVGRPSRIQVAVLDDQVRVGGTSVVVAKGQLQI
jgi:trans-2,3-dihydro-3-hydroxyanthranilate isomerase